MNAPVLKTGIGESRSGVRIPSPPLLCTTNFGGVEMFIRVGSQAGPAWLSSSALMPQLSGRLGTDHQKSAQSAGGQTLPRFGQPWLSIRLKLENFRKCNNGSADVGGHIARPKSSRNFGVIGPMLHMGHPCRWSRSARGIFVTQPVREFQRSRILSLDLLHEV